MSDVRLPRDVRLVHAWPAPGSWAFIRKSDKVAGPTAWVGCPECGQAANLSDHAIDALGRVTPSLDCPTGDCTWHVHVTLDGWAQALVEKVGT